MAQKELLVKDGDILLALWLFADLIWSVFVMGATAYIVFWRGHSGLWFLVAVALCASETLYRALRKRFGLAGRI